MLTLPLTKPGQSGQKMQLPLSKGARFIVEVAWDSKDDLDVHALLATNAGGSAKVNDFARVLSTFNTTKNNPSGVMVNNPDKSFSTPCGSLTHSGDSRTGIGKAIDEIITIDGSKVPADVNEIPIFVTIYEGSNFGSVKEASITIKDGTGKELAKFQLTKEFASFNAVQMGSLMLNANGWEFHIVGVGFNGDFNTVLGHFSE